LVANTLMLGFTIPPFPTAAQAPPGSTSQVGNRTAIAAVLDDLPTGGRTLYLSPRLADAGIEGRAFLNENELAPLTARYGARLAEMPEALGCEHPLEATCRVPLGGTFYQFLMPEPLAGGRLTLRLVRVLEPLDGPGAVVERWTFLLRRVEGVGWSVIQRSRAMGPEW